MASSCLQSRKESQREESITGCIKELLKHMITENNIKRIHSDWDTPSLRSQRSHGERRHFATLAQSRSFPRPRKYISPFGKRGNANLKEWRKHENQLKRPKSSRDLASKVSGHGKKPVNEHDMLAYTLSGFKGFGITLILQKGASVSQCTFTLLTFRRFFHFYTRSLLSCDQIISEVHGITVLPIAGSTLRFYHFAMKPSLMRNIFLK